MKPRQQILATLKSCGRSIETAEDGVRGYMDIPRHGVYFFIASWGMGWEHVSVSRPKYKGCPSWEVMCFVKDIFWFGHEAVMQLHPPDKDYVNFHPNCLHLWRPIGKEIPLPPASLVGPKT